jgi:hypothetical protein
MEMLVYLPHRPQSDIGRMQHTFPDFELKIRHAVLDFSQYAVKRLSKIVVEIEIKPESAHRRRVSVTTER